MNEIVKICKKHGELTVDDLKIGKYKNKNYRKCKKCELERSRVYYKKIFQSIDLHEKKKEKDKQYWKENKEKIKERRLKNKDSEKRRKRYKEYNEKYRESYKTKQRKYREELHDSYIRKIIQNGNKNIPFSSIPISMIKLKKAIILAKRYINERKIK